MLLPYSCSPPHPPFNHRRCHQVDGLLNGRLSLGLRKFRIYRCFDLGSTQAGANPEHTGSSSNSSTWPMQHLSNLNWLPIKWRIDFKVATLTYKVLQSGESSYLSTRIAITIPRRLLDSSSVKIKNVLFQTGLPVTLASILHCASDSTIELFAQFYSYVSACGAL